MQLEEIFWLLGGPAVLLEVPGGRKAPNAREWQKLTLDDMTPEYLAGFNGSHNVGILLGASSAGLISFDFDSQEQLDHMLTLNPWLSDTLITRGARGGNAWLRVEGPYPASCDIFSSDPKTKIAELRASGRQTVIAGRHPSGCDYVNNGKIALRVPFEKIRWPANAVLPWQESAPEPKAHAVDVDRKLIKKCGPPIIISARGAILVNQGYFVQRFCLEHLVVFEQSERAFYLYELATGAWRKVAADKIKEMLRSDWERITPALANERLLLKANDALLNALTNGVRSYSGHDDVFKRLPRGVLHVVNGMLQISSDGHCDLKGFDPQLYSRNSVPFKFNPQAKCPRFEALLRHSLEHDDADLFVRWFGSCLLEGNHAHRLILMVGVAQSSKTTLINVVKGIVGLHNCGELRTHLLDQRFEIGRLVGKTLLTASDVPGNFLQHSAAQALKKLVGHDKLVGEIKGAMGGVDVCGDFAVAITCNETLLVRLCGDSDVGAWRRRLMLIPFERAIPAEKRIQNFDQLLISEEAEGILALAIQGAIKHSQELDACGDFRRTKVQQERVETLLTESQSLRFFVLEMVRPDSESDLSTDELVRAYFAFCREKAWRSLPGKTVERELTDLMMTIHNSRVGTNVVRNQRRVRGYPGVALQSENDRNGA